MIAAIVVVASVTVFAVVGGTGLAKRPLGAGQYGPGQYQYLLHHKVVVCHKRHQTIIVSMRAWPAHKRHGDTVGPCVAASGKNHHGHHGDHHKGNDDAQGNGGHSKGNSGHSKGSGQSQASGQSQGNNESNDHGQNGKSKHD